MRRSLDEYNEDGTEDIPEDNINPWTILELVSFVLVTFLLVCSLLVPVMRRQTLWELPLWKWEILLLAVICGGLISGWGIRIIVIFIEHNFLLRGRVLYFVYGLRQAVQNCRWLGMVLLVWHCIFDDKLENKTKVLSFVSKILICLLLGTLIWLVKTIFVKVLALSFHVNTFFDRICKALVNQHVLKTLSGFKNPSTEEEEEEEEESQKTETSRFGDLVEHLLQTNKSVGVSRKLPKYPSEGKTPNFSRGKKKGKDEISIEELHKLKQETVSAWNMNRMMETVSRGHLSTLDEQISDSVMEDDALMEIRSEYQAKAAAKKILGRVAKTEPGRYIYLQDLENFMEKEEALKIMRLFGVTSVNGGISKATLKNWLVTVFRERKTLKMSLNDAKTAVLKLHRILNVFVSFLVAIIWLLILGFNITHFLVFLASQLLLMVFIFGNTCKLVFEAIIFLFVTHPGR